MRIGVTRSVSARASGERAARVDAEAASNPARGLLTRVSSPSIPAPRRDARRVDAVARARIPLAAQPARRRAPRLAPRRSETRPTHHRQLQTTAVCTGYNTDPAINRPPVLPPRMARNSSGLKSQTANSGFTAASQGNSSTSSTGEWARLESHACMQDNTERTCPPLLAPQLERARETVLVLLGDQRPLPPRPVPLCARPPAHPAARVPSQAKTPSEQRQGTAAASLEVPAHLPPRRRVQVVFARSRGPPRRLSRLSEMVPGRGTRTTTRGRLGTPCHGCQGEGRMGQEDRVRRGILILEERTNGRGRLGCRVQSRILAGCAYSVLSFLEGRKTPEERALNLHFSPLCSLGARASTASRSFGSKTSFPETIASSRHRRRRHRQSPSCGAFVSPGGHHLQYEPSSSCAGFLAAPSTSAHPEREGRRTALCADGELAR